MGATKVKPKDFRGTLRELDAAVAVEILGYEKADHLAKIMVGQGLRAEEWTGVMWDRQGFAHVLPHYSTLIEAAWKIVEAKYPHDKGFMAWWDGTNLGLCTSEEAAKYICVASLRIARMRG